jgi:hypothetical protein
MTESNAIRRRVPEIPPSGLLTIKQAAEYIGCSESYLSRRKNPRPKETRIGGKVFMHIDDVDQFIEERRAA